MNGLHLTQKLRAVQLLRLTQTVKPVKYTCVTDVKFTRQWKSPFTHSPPCTPSTYFFLLLLVPLLETMTFSISAQPSRVEVRPLQRVTIEFTIKQTSNGPNSPKYTFASLKIPSESDLSVMHDDVRTWRGSNQKKKHL